MPLTRSFKETVQARAQADPVFRQALLTEAIEALLRGEVAVGKAVLRDYINATVGFESLAAAVGMEPKSLMRMFGPRGNPTTSNLMAAIAHLQRMSGVSLQVGVRQTESGPQDAPLQDWVGAHPEGTRGTGLIGHRERSHDSQLL